MTIYQTIKNTGRKIKTAAVGGLAALAITLSSGCAASQATQTDSTPIPSEISPIKTYFGPEVGAIWALNNAGGTDYTKGSNTLGLQFGVEGGGGLKFRAGLDFYDSEARDTVNGTPYSVENDSTLATLGIVYGFGSRTNPTRAHLGLVAGNLNENTRITVGAPYHKDTIMSSNMWGYGATAGVSMNTQRGRFEVRTTWIHWPDSDNVRDTIQATVGIQKSF